MAREILFKGKRKDNGEWVEGFYAHYDTGHFIGNPNNEWRTMMWYEVDPETVGQYAGRTDKNGKRIFEGDILRQANAFHVVSWRSRSGSWGAEEIGFHGSVMSPHFFHLTKVIGNIHDNPELLNGTES